MPSQYDTHSQLPTAKYRRILLKLSGEALMGKQASGIDADILNRLSKEIIAIQKLGVQVGLVIGGGNIFRGISLEQSGIDRITGDHMGMLATVINALAMKDALNKAGASAQVMSSIEMTGVAPAYNRQQAIEHLENNTIMIFSAGTGNPLFTTDTAACLRGIEIKADLVLKATKVNGIYNDDPAKNPDAKKYNSLSYDDVLKHKLMVMDLTAICLMQEHQTPLRVFNMNKPDALQRLIIGEDEGTLVHS